MALLIDICKVSACRAQRKNGEEEMELAIVGRLETKMHFSFFAKFRFSTKFYFCENHPNIPEALRYSRNIIFANKIFMGKSY